MLLMIAIPELIRLLEQLLVSTLIMFVVQLKWLDHVSMNHLSLRIDRLNHIVKASFNVDQSGTHRIYYIDITFARMGCVLHEVFLKLLISKG